ncbi:MAG: rhodanese-like domain-containing protein [Spirochaetia bacterium]|nr:rhodanese-like domain-containing protein [Spirochaetia bacterium]
MKTVNNAVKIIFLTILFVNLSNCKPKALEASSIEIGMNEFISAYDSNEKIQLLDVRTPEEYQSGHVPRAVTLPLDELTSGATVPFEKTSEIYVICRSGKRSMAATQYLKSQGYTNVKSISGGTVAWSAQNKPLDK